MKFTPIHLTSDSNRDASHGFAGFSLRQLHTADSHALSDYFSQMSHQTRQFFGPHPLTGEYAKRLCDRRNLANDPNLRLVVNQQDGQIVGYFIVQIELNPQEQERYRRFGITLENGLAASYAPSVSEQWIGSGIGTKVFSHIKSSLQQHGIQLLVLMGGVQATNSLAIHYYRKLGFEVTGGYFSDVENIDMALRLDKH